MASRLRNGSSTKGFSCCSLVWVTGNDVYLYMSVNEGGCAKEANRACADDKHSLARLKRHPINAMNDDCEGFNQADTGWVCASRHGIQARRVDANEFSKTAIYGGAME